MALVVAECARRAAASRATRSLSLRCRAKHERAIVRCVCVVCGARRHHCILRIAIVTLEVGVVVSGLLKAQLAIFLVYDAICCASHHGRRHEATGPV